MKLEEKKTNKMFIIRRNTIIKLKVEIIKIEMIKMTISSLKGKHHCKF